MKLNDLRVESSNRNVHDSRMLLRPKQSWSMQCSILAGWLPQQNISNHSNGEFLVHAKPFFLLFHHSFCQELFMSLCTGIIMDPAFEIYQQNVSQESTMINSIIHSYSNTSLAEHTCVWKTPCLAMPPPPHTQLINPQTKVLERFEKKRIPVVEGARRCSLYQLSAIF